MEATVVSVGKSVLDGALSYAKSTIAAEVALQLGVRRDQAFITDELEMMQGFLMTAHDERDDNKVVKIWVKQVRDVAYDVEDCLLDFAVRLETRSWWWCIPRMLRERRRIGTQMKELRAKVEDVSQRNLRYQLIKGSGSKPTAVAKQSAITSATMSGIDEAKRQRDKAIFDLVRLITKKDDDLRVIAVWGASTCDLGEMSIIKRAYEDPKIHKKFECRAWIRLMHPFNQKNFLQSIIRQFYANFLQDAGERQSTTTEGQDIRRMGMINEDCLADEFKRYVNEKSYLIVLNDLLTIEEWDRIKTCLPGNKKGSRIIMCAEHVEVASLCVGPKNISPEHKQLLADQPLYAFYEKDFQDGTDSSQAGSSSNAATTDTIISVGRKSLARIETMVPAFKETELIGREKEKSDIIELITNEVSQQLEVISLWGMGGLGKTTLVRDVYQSQELSGKFEKRACVTIMRPFNHEELLQSLVVQIDAGDSENREETGRMARKTIKRDTKSLASLLEGKKYLIVLDDILSTTEWDAIIPHFCVATGRASRIIVTTREKNIANHCSKKRENIYNLQSLQYKDAHDLFTEKVFDKITNLDEQYPQLVEQANQIIKKCKGLPLAIVTIGGFLANQPKTVVEWRKLNEYISAELEMNPELGTIITVLNKSYDGLPYYLKSCFLYLPIFPEDYKVSQRRLVRRWTAEGYSGDVRGRSAVEVAESYFMELINRSMLLPAQQSIHSRKGIDSCQVHDLMREIAILKSIEENLVLRLGEGCSMNTQGTTRHLAISSDWKGDQSEFDRSVDLSRVRSITVFGKWRPFFISDKTKVLRVLDLEGSSGLHDHHLEHIGKLLHLKYLSLRGCGDISHLPDSFGNLRQLETLDARGTTIIKLPNIIVNLQKLNYLRAGMEATDEENSYEELMDEVPKLIRNRLCMSALLPIITCAVCSAAPILDLDGMNSRDVCTLFCCMLLRFVVMRLDVHGVLVPGGMRKLKALHTLGVVNIAHGNFILRDIRRLTGLRKLAVTGINKRNGQDFCSAIGHLSRLESLSVRSEGEPGLSGCLDSLSSPPENLQSLKLYGNLVKLPEWMQGLKNLVKLKLRSSRILEVYAAMQVLGKLPSLAILCVCEDAFKCEELHLNFQREAFPSLMVLELPLRSIGGGHLEGVAFEEGAAPKLELLRLRLWCLEITNLFSGLQYLPGLKEVLLDGRFQHGRLVGDLRGQLAENPNRPVLKMT